jgi:hypothetical protein
MKAYGGVKIQLHSFWTSALRGGERPSSSWHLTSAEKAPGSRWIGGWVCTKPTILLPHCHFTNKITGTSNCHITVDSHAPLKSSSALGDVSRPFVTHPIISRCTRHNPGPHRSVGCEGWQTAKTVVYKSRQQSVKTSFPACGILTWRTAQPQDVYI